MRLLLEARVLARQGDLSWLGARHPPYLNPSVEGHRETVAGGGTSQSAEGGTGCLGHIVQGRMLGAGLLAECPVLWGPSCLRVGC